jgi:hypothetical protein
MADSTGDSASRNLQPSIPRIRPVIPLGFSRQTKPKPPPSATTGPATPPKTAELTRLHEPPQATPEPPLTPESTPSNGVSRPGPFTPAESNSDPLPGEFFSAWS